MRKARIAVSVLFFTNALTLSAWLPRLAELQADISLTNVAVGAALAAGAAGGLCVLRGVMFAVSYMHVSSESDLRR